MDKFGSGVELPQLASEKGTSFIGKRHSDASATPPRPAEYGPVCGVELLPLPTEKGTEEG